MEGGGVAERSQGVSATLGTQSAPKERALEGILECVCLRLDHH